MKNIIRACEAKLELAVAGVSYTRPTKPYCKCVCPGLSAHNTVYVYCICRVELSFQRPQSYARRRCFPETFRRNTVLVYFEVDIIRLRFSFRLKRAKTNWLCWHSPKWFRRILNVANVDVCTRICLFINYDREKSNVLHYINIDELTKKKKNK